MRFRSAWLGLGTGAYLATAIAVFPAVTAYHWFAPAGILAAGIEGTVWRGRAELASVAGIGFYDLEWSASPWPLLIGRFELDLQARHPDGFVRGRVSAGMSSIRVSDLQASGTLAAARQLVPLGDVRGLLSIQLKSLELRNGWPVRASGRVRLAELEIPLLMPGGPSDLLPLGNFVIELADSEVPELSGTFEDQGGPLEVNGSFSLSETRAYELRGLVRARESAPEEIVQGLQFVTGAPDQSGRRPFELTGSL